MKEYHKTVFFSRPLREARKSCRALICCATRKRDGVDAKQSACSNVESTIRPCALLRILPMFLERRSRTFSRSSLKQTRKCAKLKYKTIKRENLQGSQFWAAHIRNFFFSMALQIFFLKLRVELKNFFLNLRIVFCLPCLSWVQAYSIYEMSRKKVNFFVCFYANDSEKRNDLKIAIAHLAWRWLEMSNGIRLADECIAIIISSEIFIWCYHFNISLKISSFHSRLSLSKIHPHLLKYRNALLMCVRSILRLL